jgi:phosphoribosylglycinamide formyltransferase 1
LIPVKTPVAICISGRGSNMEKLVEAARAPEYPARICGVLSDRADAAGLEFARRNGIPAIAVERVGFASRAEHEAAMQRTLEEWGTGFIALAGFMRVLSPAFVTRWQGRMINIHPSLLPRHKGLDTHARALAAGDLQHGCSVHWVSAEVDGGAVIAQAKVPVLPGDTPETLGLRVLQQEHRVYPAALAEALTRLQIG